MDKSTTSPDLMDAEHTSQTSLDGILLDGPSASTRDRAVADEFMSESPKPRSESHRESVLSKSDTNSNLYPKVLISDCDRSVSSWNQQLVSSNGGSSLDSELSLSLDRQRSDNLRTSEELPAAPSEVLSERTAPAEDSPRERSLLEGTHFPAGQPAVAPPVNDSGTLRDDAPVNVNAKRARTDVDVTQPLLKKQNNTTRPTNFRVAKRLEPSRLSLSNNRRQTTRKAQHSNSSEECLLWCIRALPSCAELLLCTKGAIKRIIKVLEDYNGLRKRRDLSLLLHRVREPFRSGYKLIETEPQYSIEDNASSSLPPTENGKDLIRWFTVELCFWVILKHDTIAMITELCKLMPVIFDGITPDILTRLACINEAMAHFRTGLHLLYTGRRGLISQTIAVQTYHQT